MAFYSGYGLLGSLLALALLISNTAAGLASRLARGLALAASTVLCALAKVLGLNSLDVFHINTSVLNLFICDYCSTFFYKMQYKLTRFLKIFFR